MTDDPVVSQQAPPADEAASAPAASRRWTWRDRRLELFLVPAVIVADQVAKALVRARIPLYSFARKYVDLGAIAASQLDFAALGAQVAELVRHLPAPASGAAGARWVYAREAQLVINQKVARKMGLVLDPDVLEAAADVIR